VFGEVFQYHLSLLFLVWFDEFVISCVVRSWCWASMILDINDLDYAVIHICFLEITYLITFNFYLSNRAC